MLAPVYLCCMFVWLIGNAGNVHTVSNSFTIFLVLDRLFLKVYKPVREREPVLKFDVGPHVETQREENLEFLLT